MLSHSLAIALEPPTLEGRITDKADLLSANEKQDLENIIKEYEKGASNQIAVCVIKTLEGDSLEDFSIRLAEKWKIGQKGKDNGVIILIVKDDRKIRIEVGYGLEGVLPDGLCGDIIRNEIGPNFKSEKYFEGLKKGLEAVIKATKGEYKWQGNTKKYTVDKAFTKEEDKVFTSGLFSGLALIPFLLCLGKIKKNNNKNKKNKDNTKKKSNLLWWILFVIFSIPFLSFINTIGIVNFNDWLVNIIAGLIVGIIPVGFVYLIYLGATSPSTGGSSSSWSSHSHSSRSWGSGSGWSSGGGGFSGGGGSFGGGGASGGW